MDSIRRTDSNQPSRIGPMVGGVNGKRSHGAANPLSAKKPVHGEHIRNMGYRGSKLGLQGGIRQVGAEISNGGPRRVLAQNSLQQGPSRPAPSSGFQEPSFRAHNPFG